MIKRTLFLKSISYFLKLRNSVQKHLYSLVFYHKKYMMVSSKEGENKYGKETCKNCNNWWRK